MDFKPLLPNHFSSILEYFKTHNFNLCVYSPASIIVWNNFISSPYFLEKDNTLFISNIFHKKAEKSHLIMPLSINKEISPSFLYESAVNFGFKDYWFIPEEYIENNKEIEDLFIIKEQKDYEDYIYKSENLSLLKGKKFSKKRNLLNQFTTNYINKKRVIVENINDSNMNECLIFLEKWFNDKNFDKADEDFITEKIAAETAIRNFKILNFDSVIIRIDGKIEGYTMGSRLNNDSWVLHFEKASSDIKGLYQFLDRETAINVSKNFTYINKESDMGVEGIAHSKKSYFPDKRSKSYQLTLKN